VPRRFLTVTGAVLAGAGLLVGIASLAVPWGRLRARGTAAGGSATGDGPVAVFQASGGSWYLLAVGVLVVLLAMATLGAGRAPDIALTVAPVAGILTALIAVTVANNIASSAGGVAAVGFGQVQVTAETAEGVSLGLLTGPLLGFGAGLLALARRRAP
jgi:hypothetical protein